MKHHILGPSSLPRILNCIGSLYGPPVRDEAGPAAEEGTACHNFLEFCLTFGENPRGYLGSTDVNPNFPVTIEMIEAVELFIDTVDALCKEFGIDRSAVKSEQKLVHPAIPDGLFGGTSDCIIAGNGTLIVIDLKYGRRQVFANSVQLTAYSLLALARMGDQPINRVVQIIVQPRGNPSVDRYEPGSQELSQVWTQINEAALFIQSNPDMTIPKPENLKAGEWCKYCKRREGCAARLALVTEFADTAVLAVPDVTNDTWKVVAGPTMELTTHQLVEWMAKFDVMSEFMKDVKADLVRRAGRGEAIPGHKLLVKYGNREWVDDEEKIRKKIPRLGIGLSAKDITVQKTLSVAQIEKLLKEKENWKEIKDKFELLYTSKPTGVKLANMKARGVEVTPEAMDELLATMTQESDSE